MGQIDSLVRYSYETYQPTSSINSTNDIKTSIYPNPAHNYIHVSTNEPIKLTLLDLTGVIRKSTVSNVIDCSDLPSGIYNLTIEQSGSLRVHTVTIIH